MKDVLNMFQTGERVGVAPTEGQIWEGRKSKRGLSCAWGVIDGWVDCIMLYYSRYQAIRSHRKTLGTNILNRQINDRAARDGNKTHQRYLNLKKGNLRARISYPFIAHLIVLMHFWSSSSNSPSDCVVALLFQVPSSKFKPVR